jgi:serine-type D-Ala-D-Ala carboxypeptidase/endopeptidase (penicillin-binding protein 4)
MSSRAFLVALFAALLSILLAGPASQAPAASGAGSEPEASGGEPGGESESEPGASEAEPAGNHDTDPRLGPPPGATAAQRDAWLASRIGALMAERPTLSRARVGIHVQDLSEGRAIYEHNAGEPFSVASNAKVITAAAALARLGPGFRYRTSVLAGALDGQGTVGGDLYLRGTGAPDLSTAALTRLVNDLALAGVKRVRGDLILDDTYFDDQVLPPHFGEQPQEQAAFRAPVSALGMDFGAFSVVVRPALTGRGPAAVTIDPPGDYIRIARNELITQATGRNRVLLSSKLVNDHMEVEVAGQIRADAPLWRYRLRVEDPVRHTGAVFGALLAKRGIRVQGKVARGRTPATARVLASVDSEPLAVLVHGLGKYSNNFVAEVLLKTLGAEALASGVSETGSRRVARPATWQDGLQVVERFLTEDMGLLPGTFRYGNGSGLFDSSEMSPRQLAAVLARVGRDPGYGPDLLSSLSIAGMDGTLRRRMTGTRARGRVRGKTGSLAAVSTLCGYASVDATRPLAFAVAVNGMPATWRGKREAHSLQDGIAEALVTYLDSARAER